MQHNRNFIIRLQAAIDKRMGETGVKQALLNGSKNYEEFEQIERRFFDSLIDIDLAYLQGISNQPPASTVTAEENG